MMDERKIEAMIRLLDDQDDEIYHHIEHSLFSFGEIVIEPLEHAWENSMDSFLQERIENLIHKIQFNAVRKNLEHWKTNEQEDLLQALLIINRYQYPEIDEQLIINKIEDIKRDVWMQMIYKMNPIEKVRIMNAVLFHDIGFSGNIKRYHDPQNSYLSQVLESKKGNPILLASIYSIVAQKLDIPIYGINLPKHFILAYIDKTDPNSTENEVLFYLNPFNKGQIFGKHDVVSFIKQLNLTPDPMYYNPCTNNDIIIRVLRNLIYSYSTEGSPAKVEELEQLLSIVEKTTDV